MSRTTHNRIDTVGRLRLGRHLARAAAVAVAVGLAAPAVAQSSRREELAARQAEKAQNLRPYEPADLEQRLRLIDHALFTLSDAPFYPFFGGSFDGGGMTVGAGYRGRYGDTGTFGARASWSVRNYKTTEARFALPSLGGGRVTVEFDARRIDAPEVAFYGAGNDSVSTDRAGYAYTETAAGVTARLQASSLVRLGGGLDALRLGAGTAGPGQPTNQALGPHYRRSRMFAELDSRTSPGYTRRGGLYRVEWSDYHQTNGAGLSFNRTDVEAQQFIPMLHDSVTVALRALGSTTSVAPGQDVPFFLLPDLGGSHALRGYPSWRFRDRHRVLLTGEYRWSAGSLVDMALFLDAGQVASAIGDIGWREFKKTYGIGVSVHTPTSTVTRVEVARTPDGLGFVLSFGPSF